MRQSTFVTIMVAVLIPISCVTAGSTAFLAYVTYDLLRQLSEAM